MSKTQNKVEALRRASAMILNSTVNEFAHLPTEEERHGALTEYIAMGERMRIKAIRLGGNFNRFTGLVDKKRTIRKK